MKNPFDSFLMGGFECSTHRRGDNLRLDVIAASLHDKFALEDYLRLREIGMLTARDGARWHLIEPKPYIYDFSSVTPQIEAARKANIQIIWDLFHYGFPDKLDLLSDHFIERFVAFARAFTEHLLEKGVEKPLLCIANEISFFSWIAGEVGGWYPFLRHRGDAVKLQLVKATIAAAKEIRRIAPQAVRIQTDPLVNVVPSHGNPDFVVHARNYHKAQFHALDMILGLSEPQLGGSFDLIDVIGVNYYKYNQWRHPSGRRLNFNSPDYKPFRQLLQEFYEHFRKPFFVAETGIEDDARAEWFRYISSEVAPALNAGIPIYGICLYPILNHPGWDDDRHCHNGLWDYADESGQRIIHQPLADEILVQAKIFDEMEKTGQPKYLTTHNS